MSAMTTLGPGAFRLLLAVFVLASHLSRYEIGRPAVYVFFMLSGYWVMRMYAQKYRPNVSIPVFYLSRILRIWLPFAIVFGLVFLALRVFPLGVAAPPVSYLKGLAMLGIASNDLDVLGTSWSLDIELQFYLLVPLIFLALARFSFLGLCLGTFALTLLGWLLQAQYDLWTVMAYLPPFIAGAMIWTYGKTYSGRAALVSVVIFAAIGCVVWVTPALQPLLLRDVISPFPEDWFGIAWTLILIPLVGWNVTQKSGGLDMHFGAISFMLYIVHWPVIATMRSLLNPLDTTEKAMILVVIAVATLAVYMLIDRPSERLRAAVVRRFMAQKTARPSA